MSMHIYVYGIGITVIFSVTLLFWREIQRTSAHEEKIFDFLFVSLISGLLGKQICIRFVPFFRC